MSLFGRIVRTAVNVAVLPVTIPVAVARDAITLMEGDDAHYLSDRVEQLKDEAED